jgi:hypothetical protein
MIYRNKQMQNQIFGLISAELILLRHAKRLMLPNILKNMMNPTLSPSFYE